MELWRKIMHRGALVALGFVIASCSSGNTAFELPATVVGKVLMIGNEPFAAPGLQMPDGTIYPLSGEGEVLRTICAVQGKFVRIHVDRTDTGPIGMQMRVQRVEVLKQPLN
jgi:hypothetical protein